MKRTTMKRLLSCLILLCGILSLNATTITSSNMGYNTCETATQNSANWYITQDCFAATSSSALDELTRACNRKDQSTVRQLMYQGYVVVLSKGTMVDMIKYGFAESKIKVLSGEHRGSYLYIASDFVDSK